MRTAQLLCAWCVSVCCECEVYIGYFALNNGKKHAIRTYGGVTSYVQSIYENSTAARSNANSIQD